MYMSRAHARLDCSNNYMRCALQGISDRALVTSAVPLTDATVPMTGSTARVMSGSDHAGTVLFAAANNTLFGMRVTAKVR
jgi:hypothetical protein